MDPVRVAFSLIGIVVIIIAAYYATWFIGTKASGQSYGRLRNKNINMMDRFAISKDKSFCLVEIAGKVYIIGVTNQSMTLIDTVDAAEFPETGTQRNDTETLRFSSGRNLSPWSRLLPGSRFTGRIIKKCAAFLAQKMGREFDPGDGGDDATFADSMKTAREKTARENSAAGQPDPARAERTKYTGE